MLTSSGEGGGDTASGRSISAHIHRYCTNVVAGVASSRLSGTSGGVDGNAHLGSAFSHDRRLASNGKSRLLQSSHLLDAARPKIVGNAVVLLRRARPI